MTGRDSSPEVPATTGAVAADGLVRSRWFLGRTSPKKVVHRPSCRFALSEYVWAEPYESNWALAVALVNSGADRWHKACLLCCPGLDSALRAARDGALATEVQ